jgi:hypothetical protein
MTPFLFASPDGRGSSSARRVHLRRLYDILHLSIQRGDLLLAQRSFALLSRCEDVEWAAIWKFGLIILAAADDQPDQPPPGNVNVNMLGTPKHIEFLRVMMLRHPEEVRTLDFSLFLCFFLWAPRGEGGSVSVSSFGFLPFHFRSTILSPRHFSPKFESSLANSPSFHWAARIARAGAGIVIGYGWTGARRPRRT